MATFLNYGFNEQIIKALDEIGFKSPTPIQELAIPQIINGLDIIASAQTGTGKTGAFILPTLQLLATQNSKNKGPFVLILVPTRELAEQVFIEAKKFSKYLPYLKSVCIYGGVPYPPQKRALANRCDIIVATPGRLIDHMQQGLIDFSNLKMLILDEADRMLDMGFSVAIEKIAAATPKTRQTLLFSATIDRKILPISKKLLKEPFEIKAQPTQLERASIEQFIYYTDNLGHKTRILEHILEHTKIYQTILFTSTKRQADELSRHLKDMGYSTSALHGDMNQRQRNRTLDQMRRGDLQVLVATDVAARGIDIATISHVINFDLPRNIDDFVHRIGRTGRAGATGVAITFAAYHEEMLVSKINKMMGTPMTQQTITGMEPQARNRSKPRSPYPERGMRSQSPRQSDRPYSSRSSDGGGRSSAPRYADEGTKPRSPRFSDGDKKPYSRPSYGESKPYAPRPSYGESKPYASRSSEGGMRSSSPRHTDDGMKSATPRGNFKPKFRSRGPESSTQERSKDRPYFSKPKRASSSY